MKKLLISVTFAALLLAACNNEDGKVTEPPQQEEEEEKIDQELAVLEVENEEASEQIKVVENFLKIAYFDEGSYEDFVALYANEENVITEEEFNEFRESNDPTKDFLENGDSLESISSQLVAVSTGQDAASVYWVGDRDNATQADADFVWHVVKVKDEWKVQN